MEELSEWINPEELSKLLMISKSTQNKMRMKKEIPFSKIGQKIFYNKKEINEWLNKSSVVSTNEAVTNKIERI